MTRHIATLSEIEKGVLIGMLNKHVTQDSLQMKSTMLFHNLQDASSKVLDENGEPLALYHGTGERFDVFDRSVSDRVKGGQMISKKCTT